MKSIATKVFILILSLYSIEVFSSERAFERYAAIYHEKLMLEKFEELENDAIEARDKRTTISDGQPLLAAIYGGVSGCQSLNCNFPKSLAEWQEKELKLKKWIEKYPDSITAQVGHAGYYIQLGWFHRGRGYANTVSKKSWVLFKENLEIAKTLLEGHSEKTKNDAGWNFAMVAIALYQGWPEPKFDELYEKAVSLHPTYIPVYFLKASYMAPKWHGSLEQFNLYVDNVVQNTKPTLGHQMYARLHWSSSGRNLFRSGRTDWNRMKNGFEELIANYPDLRNINNFAKFSCLAGDTQKLSELLGIIGENVLASAWFNNEEFYNSCVKATQKS
ncbi:hypothetical protein [Arsukibacterium perlucidum]|uniref:hypothetical protein n=1 Tax=Arsukibacterium perlucidum TaxID=368811 RepID=UPI00037A293C|nr:hypothetical protein [Arsukibacterium perlucidum]